MTTAELQRYFNDINSSKWDTLICKDAGLKDISESKL